MKIEVNMDKKFLVFSLLIGLVIVGFVGVYAYTPASYGHSPNEVDWTQSVNSNVLINGSEGIGTRTPGAKLHINGTGYAGIFVENSGRKFSFYANDGGNLVIGDQVAGIARITINGSTGNVGIGTASPSQKLDVSGGIKATNIIATTATLSTATVSGQVNASQICLSGDCQAGWPSSGGKPSGTFYSWSGDGNKGQTANHDFCFLIRDEPHDDNHDSRLQGCYIQPASTSDFNSPQKWTMLVRGVGGSSYCAAICLDW